jgi:hypothetical protein
MPIQATRAVIGFIPKVSGRRSEMANVAVRPGTAPKKNPKRYAHNKCNINTGSCKNPMIPERKSSIKTTPVREV